jgi:hypothetical protein
MLLQVLSIKHATKYKLKKHATKKKNMLQRHN